MNSQIPTASAVLHRVRSNPNLDVLLYVGGEISAETLLAGYRAGLFPMELEYGSTATVGWLCPQIRATIWMKKWETAGPTPFRITKSTRNAGKRLRVTMDQAFDEVVERCSDVRSDGNWINSDYRNAYHRLHLDGVGHSIEVWNDQSLVGGLFGVEVGGLFTGESMFHIQTGASKVALVALYQVLSTAGFTLLDAQWLTDHLASLGFVGTERIDYLRAVTTVSLLEPSRLSQGEIVINWRTFTPESPPEVVSD